MRRGLTALVLSVALSGAPALALETDQFYAWTRPLEDSTDVLNAKVNLEITRALEGAGPGVACSEVAERVTARFRFFVLHDLEMWIANTHLVARIPETAEEDLDFHRNYLFRHMGAQALANWVPPSPTIELNGVRLGTDKLSHFFSEGLWYYRAYRRGVEAGMGDDEAVLRSVDLGIKTERSVLGQTSSGVFSAADLEANYKGMIFLQNLCAGDAPIVERTATGWRLARPFDWRDYVTPEWDESYQPFVLSARRWKKIRPAMAVHCDELADPRVRERREAYARRDTLTLTERRIHEFVEEGRMPDPADFSIDKVCAAAGAADTAR